MDSDSSCGGCGLEAGDILSCEQFPANRNLGDLDPKYRDRFERFLAKLRTTFPQFQFIVTETYRSAERQECLRRSGASQTTHSNHQDGVAMDFCVLRKSTNQIDWRPAVYRNIYRVVDPREFGLTTGSHLWGWDEGHCQVVEVQGSGKDLSPEQEKYEQ